MSSSNSMHIATKATETSGKIGGTRLPGGHLTTHEHPEALAASIAKIERGLSINRSRI